MESETDTPLNKLSKLISRVLISQGKSIDRTIHCKHGTLLTEFFLMAPHRFPGFEKVIDSGSHAEGIALEGSDLDRMHVIQDVTVHTSQTNPERGRGSGFLLDTSGSPPGFGRLRFMYSDVSEHPLFKEYNINFQNMLMNTMDGNYLSSEIFLGTFLSRCRENPFDVQIPHGPCVMIEYDHPYRYINECPVTKRKIDILHAFKCDEWPVEAKEWITRERLHDWPPRTVVETITSQNCHVVPTGDARSRLSHLEWRISFMLGERDLVWSFNNTQLHCLFLLKMLLKKFIEPLAPDQISSYHMKTIVFWLSEEKGLPMWTDDNLLMCVTESLNMLKNCIEKAELKHYFLRQRNLLNYKLEDVMQKERVLLKIAEMQKDCVTHVLSFINRQEELLGIWTRNGQNMTKFLEATKRFPHLHHDYTERIITARNILMYSVMNQVCFEIASYELDPLQIHNFIKKLKENPPKGVMPKLIDLTKKYLDLLLGMTFFEHTTYWANQTEEYALRLVDRAQYMDSLSGVLYLVSFKFNLKQFSSAIDTILSVLRQNKRLTYIGICSINMIITLTLEGKVGQHDKIDVIFGGENMYITYDVIFPYWNLHFTPHPVKFECALEQYWEFPDIRIHPCVYAYLLLCLGYYHLGDRAHFKVYLTHLEEAVTQTVGAAYRYRALNLLGYCYYIDRKMNDALKCFRESLHETRNFPFSLNAAVYHICIMIVSVRDEQMLRVLVFLWNKLEDFLVICLRTFKSVD